MEEGEEKKTAGVTRGSEVFTASSNSQSDQDESGSRR